MTWSCLGSLADVHCSFDIQAGIGAPAAVSIVEAPAAQATPSTNPGDADTEMVAAEEGEAAHEAPQVFAHLPITFGYTILDCCAVDVLQPFQKATLLEV